MADLRRQPVPQVLVTPSIINGPPRGLPTERILSSSPEMHMFRYLPPPPGRLRFGSAVLRAGGLASVLALASLANGDPVLAEPAVDFARQILPILSNKCFACHGPDTHGDEMLRLDSFASATADRGGYRAIDPESPEESELLARIHSEDCADATGRGRETVDGRRAGTALAMGPPRR